MADKTHGNSHQHGSMDIRTQERTFDSFLWYVSRGVILSVGILLFLAIFNT